jgi:hypothetical protein
VEKNRGRRWKKGGKKVVKIATAHFALTQSLNPFPLLKERDLSIKGIIPLFSAKRGARGELQN